VTTCAEIGRSRPAQAGLGELLDRPAVALQHAGVMPTDVSVATLGVVRGLGRL